MHILPGSSSIMVRNNNTIGIDAEIAFNYKKLSLRLDKYLQRQIHLFAHLVAFRLVYVAGLPILL